MLSGRISVGYVPVGRCGILYLLLFLCFFVNLTLDVLFSCMIG